MVIIGDVAHIIDMIKRIINAIETAHMLKEDFLEFKGYLWFISKNLEQLQGMRLSAITVESLRKLEVVLDNAYQCINSSQNHNFVYLMANSASIQKQIKKAHDMVVDYMTTYIPIIHFCETIRSRSERTSTNLREQHESTPNGTDAVSNSGCLMVQGVCNSQITLSNQAEFKNDLRIFKFKNLRSATNNFKHCHLIGEGGFSSVYKGLVKDNNGLDTLVVAIKRLHNDQVLQPSKEAELNYLRRISHPNVIKLLGYCKEIDKKKWIGFCREEANNYLLVFEYMANGSLSDHLFSDTQAFESLSWVQRINIANGFARALTFLHKSQIIHRDAKSSNILLDSNFNSKLADFRLAMDFPTYSTDKDEVRCGTLGYIAPEYITYGQLSEKIDVYGFGVTLLEILSGQRVYDLGLKLMSQEFQSPEDSSTSQEFQSPVDASPFDYLQKFIISSTSGLKNLDSLMDKKLDGKYSLEAARLAVQLVLNCVASDPNKRPSMEEATKVLEQIQIIKISSATSPPGGIISDPCDPLSCDINLFVSRSMFSEPAPFDAETELSFPKFKTSHSSIMLKYDLPK